MAAPQAEQPDFGEMSANFHSLGRNIERFTNLPALDGGVGVLDRIGRLEQFLVEFRTEMREGQQRLREGQQRLDERLGSMGVMMRVGAANELARTENRDATRDDSPLTPLRRLDSGEDIPNFPPTLGAISVLTAPQARVILEALGLPVEGNLREKRKRVRYAVGVSLVRP